MDSLRPAAKGVGEAIWDSAAGAVSSAMSAMSTGVQKATKAVMDKIGSVGEKQSASLDERAAKNMSRFVPDAAKNMFKDAKNFLAGGKKGEVKEAKTDGKQKGEGAKRKEEKETEPVGGPPSTEDVGTNLQKNMPKDAKAKNIDATQDKKVDSKPVQQKEVKEAEEEEEFFDAEEGELAGRGNPPETVKLTETTAANNNPAVKIEEKKTESSSITDKIIGALKKAWDIFKTPKAQEIFKAAIIGTALLLGALALISLFAFPPAAAAFAIAAVAVAGVGLVTYNAINMFVTQPEKAIEEEKKQEIKDKKHIGKWDEKVSTLEQEIPKKTGELNQLNKEIETHKGELAGLKTELAGLEKGTPEFANIQKQVTDKESQIKKEEADRNGLQIQIKNKEAELQLLQEKGKPEGEIGKLRKRHPEAFRDGLQAKNEIEGWKKDVEATRGEIGNLRGKKVSLENKIKTLQNDPAKVAEDPAKAAELEAAEKDLAENDANLAKLQTQYDGLKSQKEDKEKLARERHLERQVDLSKVNFDIPTPNQPILQRDFSPERTALLLKSNQELIDKGGTAPQLREAIRQTEVNLREDSQNTDVNKELILQLDKLNERLQKPLPSLPPQSSAPLDPKLF